MALPLNRRRFLQASAACAATVVATEAKTAREPRPIGKLTLNDDGYTFPCMSDELDKEDLARYLASYCRPGVDTVAFCVGDMSWPTFHPTKVGVHYSAMPAMDWKQARMHRNLDNLASEPGGYFGAAFAILRGMGKRALASFRMNDAHFTTSDNPQVSEFWKQHAKLALGPEYGYYGGCLNYTHDAVRAHFYDRVVEFAEIYPDVDGIELDAMRSPFFFPRGKGAEQAPVFTDLVRRIRQALAAQARRLKRPDYLLTINVPRTPELALECGLDVAAWDAERLVDCVSTGTYQATMDVPIEAWKKHLPNGTPVFAYINCSPQDGQYLGLEEYRAAAANAHASGADGIYLFNYPCLFELAVQVPTAADQVAMTLRDLRLHGQPDLSKVAQALDEIGSAEMLVGKDKRFLFHFVSEAGYRHFAPALPGIDRGRGTPIVATFRSYEDYERASAMTLRFKITNVARTERFRTTLNGRALEPRAGELQYAAGGRDARMHTVALGPYLQHDVALRPGQLRKGENCLEVAPGKLLAGLTTRIKLVEIELVVRYRSA